MINLNKAHLIGRLGNDPVMRLTQKGTKVTTFSLATQDYIKSKEENETTWHRVVIWGQSADFCAKYLKKGDSVHVEGSMRVRKFEGEDGRMNYMHEIHSAKVQTLAYKREKEIFEPVALHEIVPEHSIEQDVPHHQS